MTPTLNDLIVEWLHANTQYKAEVKKVGRYETIFIREQDRTVAWIYLDGAPRWQAPAGLYFLAELGDTSVVENYANWKPHTLLPAGNPGFFDALKKELDAGPRPFV